MVAGSKAKQPQVTGDVLRASGAMLLSHLATLELSKVKGKTRLFCFNVKQCYSCANYLMAITVNKLLTVISIK